MDSSTQIKKYSLFDKLISSLLLIYSNKYGLGFNSGPIIEDLIILVCQKQTITIVFHNHFFSGSCLTSLLTYIIDHKIDQSETPKYSDCDSDYFYLQIALTKEDRKN